MPNSRFNTMISQHCSNFRSQFIDLSERLFGIEEEEERAKFKKKKVLKKKRGPFPPFHPGEFGGHRELVSTMFLRPFTPDRFELASGFVLGADDGSTKIEDLAAIKPAQCDILVIERDLAPFCRHRELGQFYPLEATSAFGEVKSQLTEAKLNDVLAQISKQTTEVKRRTSLLSGQDSSWNSGAEMWSDENDQWAVALNGKLCSPLVFLICRSFAFEEASGTLPLWKKVRRRIDQFAKDSKNDTIPDAILSITDGLLIRRWKYRDDEYQCISPGKDSTTHLKKFLSLYFSHLARWQTQRFTFQRYFQVSELDMVFDDGELSED